MFLRHRTRDGERGVAVAWLALTLLVLLGMAGFAVDVWQWYYTVQHTQRAADAGALAGAVYMPSDPVRAESTARDAAGANGYGTSAVDVDPGASDAQLQVEVTETVNNNFLGIFGIDSTTVSRTAVAEYQGPVPMGSPVNQLGNDPFGDQSNDTVAPRFWVNVAAPNATTQSGDRHQGGNCSLAADNCSGSTNVDYEPNGYFFVVDVRAVGAGDLRFQAYDPGFFFVGDRCNNNLYTAGDPRLTTLAAAPFNITDAAQRYVSGNNRYCAGDQNIQGQDIDTDFIIRGPDDTPFSSLDNPVLCTKRFVDRNGDVNGLDTMLRDSTVLSPEGLRFRDFFRQWADLCTVSNPQVGQYLIQVRSNASVSDPLAYDPSVATGGHNRLSLRAGFGNAPAPASVNSANVGFFANGRLPIYVNQNDGSTTTNFYLARITPLNANRTLELNFFDIGDVSNGTVTLSIVPPAEATIDPNPNDATPGTPLTSFAGCQFTPRGSPTENLTSCSRSGMSSGTGFQGRIVRVLVPIPAGYTCNAASFSAGCWIRVRLSFTGGALPSDTTTWSANMLGDPVRLIE